MALPSWHDYADAGLSAFTGSAGSAITALDAVLVNGYNSKTVTGTVAGGVATMTATAHGFSADYGKRVTIAGVTNETSCNGIKDITVINANSFSFPAVGVPDGALTGTITAKRSSLGWTKTYASGNTAIYTPASADVGTDPFVMKIVDGTTEFTAQCGTAHDGAGALTNGSNLRYHMKFSAVGRWYIIGDGGMWYLITEVATLLPEAGGADTVRLSYCGRAVATQSFYPAPTMLGGRSSSATGNNDADRAAYSSAFGDTSPENPIALFNYSQTTLNVNTAAHAYGITGTFSGRVTSTSFPSPVVGGFFMGPMLLSQSADSIGPYAMLPGLRFIYCYATTNTTASRPARGIHNTIAGKVLVLYHQGESSYSAPVAFVMDAPWRT